MEVSIHECKNPFWLVTRVFNNMNRLINLPASIGGKSSLITAKRGEQIVSALNSLALWPFFRPQPIMLKILRIMLLSSAQKNCH